MDSRDLAVCRGGEAANEDYENRALGRAGSNSGTGQQQANTLHQERRRPITRRKPSEEVTCTFILILYYVQQSRHDSVLFPAIPCAGYNHMHGALGHVRESRRRRRQARRLPHFASPLFEIESTIKVFHRGANQPAKAHFHLHSVSRRSVRKYLSTFRNSADSRTTQQDIERYS